MMRKHEKTLEQVVKWYNKICLNIQNNVLPKHRLKILHSMGLLVTNTTDLHNKI